MCQPCPSALVGFQSRSTWPSSNPGPCRGREAPRWGPPHPAPGLQPPGSKPFPFPSSPGTPFPGPYPWGGGLPQDIRCSALLGTHPSAAHRPVHPSTCPSSEPRQAAHSRSSLSPSWGLSLGTLLSSCLSAQPGMSRAGWCGWGSGRMATLAVPVVALTPHAFWPHIRPQLLITDPRAGPAQQHT